jgi:hypothetical protein
MLNENTTTAPILISGGSDDSNWDFDAVTSYLNESTQHGVLIVDGDIDDSVRDNESIDRNGDSDNDLSYPDSLPTEIGSLQDSHAQYSKLRLIRIFVISVMFSVPTIASAFLVHDRQLLQQRNLELEREIAHMKEIAANAIVVSHQGTSRQGLFHGDDGQGDESSDMDWKFKLIDNCWFKAELELRECANEAKDSFSDTAEKVYDYFVGSANGNANANDDDKPDNSHGNYCALAALTTDASETVVTAASKVIDSVWSMWSEGWGAPVLLDAMEQTRDAIRDALPDQLVYSKQD